MNCSEVRIGEYLDGELDAPARAAAEEHLSGCESCRNGLAELRSLEGMLRSNFPVTSPDPGRFVEEVRRRARRPRFAWAAAAAIAVAAIALAMFPRTGPVDVLAELERYARKHDPAIVARIASTGEVGIHDLEDALDDPDVRIQAAALTVLLQVGDDAKRAELLERYKSGEETSGNWVLADIGAEEDDVMMVPAAVSMALDETQQAFAMDVLLQLNRMDRDVRRSILEEVVSLLKSKEPKKQKVGLVIARKLDIEFSLSAVVDLLDSPELGNEAHRFLKRYTGVDHGKDKDAWRRAIGLEERR